jgi:hypothetical protein
MRDLLLRLCMRAYPRSMRKRDGEVLLDLTRELVEDGSPAFRQAAGLLRGGTRSRLRHAASGSQCLPWSEARSRLALPLAAALFAVALAGAEHSTPGLAWIGWSWALTLVGATAALAGAAIGRSDLTAAGALVLAAMLAVDGVRDVYGAGSRWAVPVGDSVVDVLVMWAPAALLLLACAGAVERAPAHVGATRLAWGMVPAVVLVVIAAERTTAAEATLVFGGLVASACLVAAGVIRRRNDRAATLGSALVLAAATPAGLWLSMMLLPAADSWGGVLPLVYFGLAGSVAAAGVLGLARLAGR